VTQNQESKKTLFFFKKFSPPRFFFASKNFGFFGFQKLGHILHIYLPVHFFRDPIYDNDTSIEQISDLCAQVILSPKCDPKSDLKKKLSFFKKIFTPSIFFRE
jgi:hypothetical protein